MKNAQDHQLFIKRTFELALRGGKNVRPNPNVGAILVHEGKIIGEGWHKKFGGPHAEVNCIDSVADKWRHLIPASTLYVSLEPCSFHGKTPSCTKLILEHKIPRVVVSSKDPNAMVNGKGIQMLRDNGVEVIDSILENEGDQLIDTFRVNQTENRPYIILKIVKSRYNFIGELGKQHWLSNAYSTILSHKWRSEIDGIMVGTNTVLNDNPSLTTRLFPGDSPVKILLDQHDKIPGAANVYDGQSPVYVVKPGRSDSPPSPGVLNLDFKSEDHLETLVSKLFKMGIYMLMVEGGATLIRSFLKQGLWDEARIIQTDHPLNTGVKAPNIEGILREKEQLGTDTYLRISRKI